MKLFTLLLSAGVFSSALLFKQQEEKTSGMSISNKTRFLSSGKNILPLKLTGPATVSDVVTKALAFKALLTTTQQSTLQQTYTTTLARKWSNLPCGSTCRNGIQIGTLTATQLTAALEVIQAAAGTTTNEGYDEFLQIRAAEEVLQATAGGTNYDEGNYYISFLNTPSASSAWMLQYGGHHYGANIAFNGGNVVGTTPMFEGVEPISWTTGATTYSPLSTEHDAMANMLAGLSASELATAKLSGTYSDVTLAPGETNGGSGTFPTTKVGLAVSTLTAAKKLLVLAAIQPWVQDVDDASAATLLSVYQNELDATYIAYTGNGTSGNAGSFLNANTNYVRVDGTSVWIEFICQTGVVFPAQIHYHSVWRDHTRDYGADLANTTLPVSLLSFTATMYDNKKTIAWSTAQEINVNHFEIEYTTDPSGGFKKITDIPATNTSNIKSYSFTDNITTSEVTGYYRLKVIDNNGSFTYSSVALIKAASVKSLVIFPTPATNKINITVPVEMNNATIKIIDSYGRNVLAINNVTGFRKEMFVSAFPAGIYFVRVLDNRTVYYSNFIKQ